MNSTILKQRYQSAFDSFLEKIKTDETIIAAYLYGSLARGDLWEESDLDVFLVTKDERRDQRTFALVEDDITFHCDVFSRSSFRRMHERLLRGTAAHHVFTSGKLVYTQDESLVDYFQDIAYMGESDREHLMLFYATVALGYIHDVRKALISHHDPLSAFIWMMFVIMCLAELEVVSRGEIITREVVVQASRLNPQVFEKLFIGCINGKKDIAGMQECLTLAEDYLTGRIDVIFSPLLAFLAERGPAVGASDISRHFTARLLLGADDFRLIGACEWLVKRGILQKVCSPIKLTLRSRMTADEPAYSYNGGNDHA